MWLWWDLLLTVIKTEEFGDKLKEILSSLNISISELAKTSGIPESTLYKITSNKDVDIRISTLRKIIRALMKYEKYGVEKYTIAVITAREALEGVKRSITFEGETVFIKEYPATSIEEEIIQGIKAEREGVKAIVCGPIAAMSLNKIVLIPVIGLKFEEGPLMNAIERASEKILHKVE